MEQEQIKGTLSRSSDWIGRWSEIIVGSSFGAAILYSIFWGAFQSLAVGHFILNESRFVAAASASEGSVGTITPNLPNTKKTASEDADLPAVGDAMEIWYGSAVHQSWLHPCVVNFEFTGKNLTNYQLGSDRRLNPREAKYLPNYGFAKNPKLPGPYIYVHFESAFGTSRSYQLNYQFKRDATGKVMGELPELETFAATAVAQPSVWECITLVFVGGGFKIVDFSDFSFAKTADTAATGQ